MRLPDRSVVRSALPPETERERARRDADFAGPTRGRGRPKSGSGIYLSPELRQEKRPVSRWMVEMRKGLSRSSFSSSAPKGEGVEARTGSLATVARSHADASEPCVAGPAGCAVATWTGAATAATGAGGRTGTRAERRGGGLKRAAGGGGGAVRTAASDRAARGGGGGGALLPGTGGGFGRRAAGALGGRGVGGGEALTRLGGGGAEGRAATFAFAPPRTS